MKNDPVEPLRHPPPAEWIEKPGGGRVPVRVFHAAGTGRPLVLLHGLQSHSGWFVQSAERAAATGFPAYAFDRCGSGMSKDPCDPGQQLSGLLEEIDVVVDRALAGSGYDSVHLLGHCFGSIPALLYAGLHQPGRVASLVLATPALYTYTDLPIRDKLRVFRSILTRRPVEIPVILRAEDFSEEEVFQDFVRADPLVRGEFPARFLFELSRARRLLPSAAESVRAPVLVAMAGQDVICDNQRGRRLLGRVPTPTEFRTYPSARHVLEFSGERATFLADLAHWLTRAGGG